MRITDGTETMEVSVFSHGDFHRLRSRNSNVRRVDFGQAYGTGSMFFENTKTKGSTLPRGFVNHYRDNSLIAQGDGWKLNYRLGALTYVLTLDWRDGCPEPRTLAHNPKWADIGNRNRIEESASCRVPRHRRT